MNQPETVEHPPAHRNGRRGETILCTPNEYRELEHWRLAVTDLLDRCDVADQLFFSNGGSLTTAEIRRCFA